MIRFDHVEKIYREGEVPVAALRGVSLEIPNGQFVAVMGPSGSGKSTLLNLMGALDRATSGAITLDGRAYATMSDDELSAVRRRSIGFVFQFFNLLPTLSARENVLLPALLDGRSTREIEQRADQLLEQVGLGRRAHDRPADLSGGQMQRVAIARALVTRPSLILADEPTGNVDRKTGQALLALLREAAQESGATVVMVTHDPEAAALSDRTLTICDGELAGDQPAARA